MKIKLISTQVVVEVRVELGNDPQCKITIIILRIDKPVPSFD